MNKSVVIYESKYGSTRRYAQWIAEELDCPLFQRKDFHAKNFANYEVVIYGGGLYAGRVSGINLITQNWDSLAGKKVILFTCGIADPAESSSISHIKDSLAKVLPPERLEHIRVFHLRGGIDYSRLSLLHRAMMSMLRKALLKKDADSLSREDKLLLETYGTFVDFTEYNSILPLTEYAASPSK